MIVGSAEAKALHQFFMESVKSYGRGDIMLTRDADGRRRFETQNNEFRLTDEFDGGNPFCGIVRIIRKADSQAIWNSYYHGWLTKEASACGRPDVEIFNFVREALQHPNDDTVSRGPVQYVRGQLRYANKHEYGDSNCFYGEEVVFCSGNTEPVYRCRYGGGLINLSEDAGEALG